MNRKLITACMALAAFAAFAIGPATASAANDPQLTDSGGKLVPAGTAFNATTIGNFVIKDTSNNALLTCTAGGFAGTIAANEKGTVEANVTEAGWAGAGGVQAGEPNPECTGIANGGLTVGSFGVWCLRSNPTMATDEFQLSRGECSKLPANMKFIVATTTVGKCEYEATSSVLKGTYKTSPTDALLTFAPNSTTTGFKRVGASSVLCPSTATWELTVTLEKDVAMAEPFYIS